MKSAREAAQDALAQAKKDGRLTTHLRNPPPLPYDPLTGQRLGDPAAVSAQRNRERANRTKARRENTWVSQKDNPREQE